jgi:hypothetical protein
MEDQLVERRCSLEGTLEPQVHPCGAGKFQILAITAGMGNGWNFPAAALQKSLPLWEGVECFIDHQPAPAGGHSVRDLGGVCTHPAWCEEAQGVQVELVTLGPSGRLVEEMGRQVLAAAKSGGTRPRVGFSADIVFTAKNQVVVEVLRVHSLDLVFNPARGGGFVRALNQIQEGVTMENEGNQMPPSSPGQEALQKMHKEVCAGLLETSLASSRLPDTMQSMLRRQFQDRAFQSGELQAAIDESRKLVSELTGAHSVQGLGRVHAVFDSRDQLQAAVDDLFEAPRDGALAGLETARLSGIRELYLLLTGDLDMHGGYYPNRARLATTADFSGLVKNAMNKVVANRWEELGRAGYDWWKRVALVEHFDRLQQITGTLIGTVGDLPTISEGEEYSELAVGDSPETADFIKYGGYIPLTLELIDRDETRKLKAYPRELASAGLRKISSLVAAVFSANGGVGPTLADGGTLFNPTTQATAGGHKNLLSGALSSAQWDLVSTAVYDQPQLVKNGSGFTGLGPKMAINPRYLLVPRAMQLAAMKILYPTLENAVSIYSENQQRGQPGDVVTVPEWTDANNWAAVCDPRIAPAIFVGERFGIMPQVFIAGDETLPAVFMNDETRLKVRHFLAVWVNDYRPLHKSNVA